MPIVLRPQGKLDLLGAATLQHKLERLANIGLTNHNIWIFDLSEINFINHFGLTTLVMARQLEQLMMPGFEITGISAIRKD